MLRRREVLTGSAAMAVGVVLASCSSGAGGEGEDAVATSSGESTMASSTSPAPVSSDPVVLKSVWQGEALTTRVGPAVVQGGYTVVMMTISVDSGERFSLGNSMFGDGLNIGTLASVKLTSLRDNVVYREVGRARVVAGYIEPGASAELFPVFGALPDGVESVELLLPTMGMALNVPVVAAGAAGFDVTAAIADAQIDESIHSGPFELNSLVVAADRSSDTEKDDASTTVNVSGDVLFATDSADLSDAADAVLASVVEQLELHPSGGELAVTGHTDDVSTDAHNQDLSEQRAKAVSDRLGELTDLSAWETSVSGKGESEPRVANDSDENRQLNRRVEIVLTPADPDEGAAAGATSTGGSGDMPDPKGPAGRGPDGVDIEIDGVPARISLASVTRHEGYLIGTVTIASKQELSVPPFLMEIPHDLLFIRMWSSYATSGCTLLKGDSRHLVVDFMNSDEDSVVLAGYISGTMKADDVRSLPVVWPDTGEDTVIMDMIGEDDAFGQHLAVRLTDIPVVDG
ncbi:OmpA family protein [Actinomyces sp. 565]|uniref:OmpA family protein n=1 Tax=Actinomyces sp. 565 TaxID=2057794 RepID=UPI001EF0A4AF|nr:OmpA family protein [Actinomyces sp. 565]